MEEIVERPWGNYQTIVRGDTYQVKRIVVYPNSKLSLQSHNYRAEHWVVVEGEGVAILDNKEIKLKKNDNIFIPIKEKHRMSNLTNEKLVFIEVQNGNNLSEDDIIRYEDIYGRN